MVIPPDDHWNLENPMENDDNPMNFGVHYFQTTQMSHEICQIECQLDNVSADVTVWCQELCQYICPNMFMSDASEFWLDFYAVALRWRWHKVTWFPEMFIVGPSFVLPGLGISPRDPGFVTAGHHHFQRGHQCLRERLGSFNAASMDW